MAGPERSIAAERTIGAKRTIGAERTTATGRTGLRRPVGPRSVGLGSGGLRRLGLRRLRLRGLRLRGLALRWLRRRRLGLGWLGLSGLDRGRGIGPVGEHGHHQRDDRTGNEQAQERRYPGKAFLRGQHGAHLPLSDRGLDRLPPIRGPMTCPAGLCGLADRRSRTGADGPPGQCRRSSFGRHCGWNGIQGADSSTGEPGRSSRGP